MSVEKAIELGKVAGREAVDEFAVELRDSADSELAADLLRTLAPGHVQWSEGAIGARAHRLDGVPDEFRNEYYSAYDAGAAERIGELVKDGGQNA